MPKKRTHRDTPARCSCMGGPNQAKEHARPGAKAADHGNVFAHTGGCMHSELSLTTSAKRATPTANRLRLQ